MSRSIARKAFDISITCEIVRHAVDVLSESSDEDASLRTMAEEIASGGEDYWSRIHVAAHDRVPANYVPGTAELSSWKGAAARFADIVGARDPQWMMDFVDELPVWAQGKGAARLRKGAQEVLDAN